MTTDIVITRAAIYTIECRTLVTAYLEYLEHDLKNGSIIPSPHFFVLSILKKLHFFTRFLFFFSLSSIFKDIS